MKKYIMFVFNIFKRNNEKQKFKYLGCNVIIKQPTIIEGTNNVSIDENTVIGNFVHIWGNGGVEIGKNVLIAAHCCITSLGHDTTKEDMNLHIISKSVIIGDDVWLGYNVTILPGVKIGKGAVVGAGSVVSKDLPAYSISIGTPAKVIKFRKVNNSYE